jgi:hypothetical protein
VGIFLLVECLRQTIQQGCTEVAKVRSVWLGKGKVDTSKTSKTRSSITALGRDKLLRNKMSFGTFFKTQNFEKLFAKAIRKWQA